MDITGTHLSDALFGTSGDDHLYGKGGIDFLDGGAGNDTLTGGGGQDEFALGMGGGHDLVTDYHTGETLFFNFGELAGSDPIHEAANYMFGAGDEIVTTSGHVMTGSESAAGLVLTWDTGESITLQGVQAVSTQVFNFYPDGWVF